MHGGIPQTFQFYRFEPPKHTNRRSDKMPAFHEALRALPLVRIRARLASYLVAFFEHVEAQFKFTEMKSVATVHLRI